MNMLPHSTVSFYFKVDVSEEVALKISIVYRKISLFSEVCSQDPVQEGIQYVINFMEVNLTLWFQ